MNKRAFFKIKGMQRDLSASAFTSEYAYENKNIRIMPTDESTLFSIVNERGTKLADINGLENNLKGVPIGQAVIDNELIIFSAGDQSLKTIEDITPDIDTVNDITSDNISIDIDSDYEDRIYKLWMDSNNLYGTTLYRGMLNLNALYPIETLSFYENESIKKIYWTDRLNQPRVINVAAASSVIDKWNDTSFDFIRKLKLQESVTIKKSTISSGSFSSGTIQYAFTYFDKYGQESNIFYTSPLYYISYDDRGASPEDKVGNSFNISIDNVDKNFDYARIYSIHRTSLDAVPTVKRVVDLAIPYGESLYNLKIWGKKASELDVMVRPSSSKFYVPISTISPTSSTAFSKIWELSGTSYTDLKFIDKDHVDISISKILIVSIVKDRFITIYYKDDSNMEVYLYSESRVIYTDNGTMGDIIDPTELLYIGGEEVIFGTMSQKDNTLFLGDITLKRKLIDSTIREFLREGNITFSTNTAKKFLIPPDPSGYYPYDNQLKYNSFKIKTFKYLETYRFGVQFQHVSGKWSEPIWINDVKNTSHITGYYINSSNIGLPVASYTLDNKDIIDKLLSQEYIRVRPVIVYPSLSDRECVCQGILCPTVFNVSDRYGNSPFAQSSWFTRANAPFDGYKANNEQDWTDRDLGPLKPVSMNSRAGVVNTNLITKEGVKDLPLKGSWAEFRHFRPIPSNNERNAEIQCIWNPPTNPGVPDDYTDSDINTWVSNNSENFYIDQSILTLHSPDIEFDDSLKNINTTGFQLRIIGMVPLTAFVGDIDIQTSTPPNNLWGKADVSFGFYKEPISSENISRFGWKGLISMPFWFDTPSNIDGMGLTGFVIYPFHRNGSLNNQKNPTEGYTSAMLDKKKLSNLRYSYNTYFLDFDNIYDLYNNNDSNKTGISGVSIFDSNEVSLIRLPSPENSDLEDINYYGNIDKIINISRVEDKKDGYPIIVSGIIDSDAKYYHNIFIGNYARLASSASNYCFGVDPIRMTYKSTPHAVLALNYTKDNKQRILPTIKDANVTTGGYELWDVNVPEGLEEGNHTFWDKNKTCTGIYQDVLNIPLHYLNGSYNGYSIEYGWLWLGEIYNPNVTNRFGGKTEEAFENNQWLPCGDPISLRDETGNTKGKVVIEWTEGDTYYQRYDHIKTYPFTSEDQNAITDIVSFMCETRVNIDGRYDKNRGQTNNLSMTPTNFNLLNTAYSQQNNFFNYRTVNPNKLNLDNFHNSITWTKTKTAGELVDTWTNITLASTLDLDGDKGNVRAIRRFNNNLIAFQDKGISQILYNENMQISSTEGVPIEIANSGKVYGKRYLTDRIGCSNKWSICETSNGIYFIDDITKGIFLFNSKLDNISDRLGFHSWINSRSTGINIWNPKDFNGFVTYYDKVNGDVFFISKDECLAFSEPLGQFTSFYSYESMPYFINLKDKGIAINRTNQDSAYKIWLHNEGEYNIFFDKYQPFYTTIIANPDIALDKIFNNLEFRSDSWNGDTLLNSTFDTLTTWNEYQWGEINLNNILGTPSSLKRKFRIWRANIPRDKSNGRDRMRNPWLYIKLAMNKENTDKTILHDMMVYYFE